MNQVLLFFFFVASLLTAQIPNIRVSAADDNNPEEVTIAINPKDPLNLAAGANIDYYYYSFDGGMTWSQGNLKSSLGVWGDPCVIFDLDGNLYFSHLSDPVKGYWIDRIVVQKSSDGGMNWNDGVGVGFERPKNQDKEWMAVDMTESPYSNNLYMSWTEFDTYGSVAPTDSSRIVFSRSVNHGVRWSAPITISDVGGDCRDGDNTVEGAVPAVGPNGEVYLSWSGPNGILFDRSFDGGNTFGKDIFVTNQPGGWAFSVPGILRTNGFPITACDISSSAYRGTIYILFSDQRNGEDDTDVFIVKSIDQGETWTDPVRVNDDSGKRHQFFPWFTIDQKSGTLYSVFYDRRDTKGISTHVYLARSDDGGQTFKNMRISNLAFTPNEYVFFGDYINIAAWDGRVYPIWMRMDDSNLSVWMAVIEESIRIEAPVPYTKSFKLKQNYPNPFNNGTRIEFDIYKPTEIEINVYDVEGISVEKLLSGSKLRAHIHSTGMPVNMQADYTIVS